MALESGSIGSFEFPMANGASPCSYRINSAYQRRVVHATKELVHSVVMEKLELMESVKMFHITDMGCSIGPNTFISVQNIVDALKLKLQKNSIEAEIQVFFNDYAFNDFNTLFASLPKNTSYYASAAVGSFYDRVFPSQSLHIVNCSYGLHFLSTLPTHSMNIGKIYYCRSNEMSEAYINQHENDMESFLKARAQEVVPGGLVFITLPARPDGTPHSRVIYNMLLDILGSCLFHLAKKGDIEEEKVDSFHIPVYITSPSEVEAAINKNGSFSIEKLEILPKETSPANGLTPKNASLHIRAITEGLIEEKFGPKILDSLFELYTQKLEDAYHHLLSGEAISLFVALKRKTN